MPEVGVDGCRLVFEVAGPPAAPACLMLHSLGTTSALWDPQWEPVGRRFRVIRYDVRGHGRSQPPAGPFTLDRLGRDALAVLDAAGVRQAHVCGVSLGGLTALWLGVQARSRVRGIVAANTAARLGSRAGWAGRIEAVRGGSMEAVADGVVARWFSDRYRERAPDTVARFRSMLLACPVEGYAGGCAVLRDADLRANIDRIVAPTLVVTGLHDDATPPPLGALICERVAGARLLELDAAHLSNVEQAEAFTGGVLDFLCGQPHPAGG